MPSGQQVVYHDIYHLLAGSFYFRAFASGRCSRCAAPGGGMIASFPFY